MDRELFLYRASQSTAPGVYTLPGAAAVLALDLYTHCHYLPLQRKRDRGERVYPLTYFLIPNSGETCQYQSIQLSGRSDFSSTQFTCPRLAQADQSILL